MPLIRHSRNSMMCDRLKIVSKFVVSFCLWLQTIHQTMQSNISPWITNFQWLCCILGNRPNFNMMRSLHFIELYRFHSKTHSFDFWFTGWGYHQWSKWTNQNNMVIIRLETTDVHTCGKKQQKKTPFVSYFPQKQNTKKSKREKKKTA